MTAALHVVGGEWEYDAGCDCPRCSDYRDARCPKCSAPWDWDGDTESSRICLNCRPEPEVDHAWDANYKPGHSSDFPF